MYFSAVCAVSFYVMLLTSILRDLNRLHFFALTNFIYLTFKKSLHSVVAQEKACFPHLYQSHNLEFEIG